MKTALDALVEQIADTVAEQASAKIIARLDRLSEPDPVLSIAKAAKEVGMSETMLRQIVQAGHIPTAPGFTDLRIKRSELRKYGTKQP